MNTPANNLNSLKSRVADDALAEQYLAQEATRLFDMLNPTFVDGQGLIVQFIGSRKDEGTSTVARAFARVAMSHVEGDVLLLNLDMTNNDHCRYFQSSANQARLGSMSGPLDVGLQAGQLVRLAEQPDGGAKDAVIGDQLVTFHRLGDSTLYLNQFTTPPVRIKSPVVNERAFWRELRNRFILTIVDSPPFSDSPSGIVISQHPDAVILVVEAEETRVPVVENLKNNLIGQGAKLAGIVFNKRQYYIPKRIYRWL